MKKKEKGWMIKGLVSPSWRWEDFNSTFILYISLTRYTFCSDVNWIK